MNRHRHSPDPPKPTANEACLCGPCCQRVQTSTSALRANRCSSHKPAPATKRRLWRWWPAPNPVRSRVKFVFGPFSQSEAFCLALFSLPPIFLPHRTMVTVCLILPPGKLSGVVGVGSCQGSVNRRSCQVTTSLRGEHFFCAITPGLVWNRNIRNKKSNRGRRALDFRRQNLFLQYPPPGEGKYPCLTNS